MSAAPVLIIIRRPRPRPAGGPITDELEVSILPEPGESDADLLRRVADQLDSGLILPPAA